MPEAKVHSGGHAEIVSQSARHLKWRALDPLERVMMAISGICLLGFTLSELGDVFFRILHRPWLSAQEFAIFFFIWGAFLGGATGVRRDTHFKISAIVEQMHGMRRIVFETIKRAVMLGVAATLIYEGWINYLQGFGSFMVPSGTPIAVLYAAIPVSGCFIALFTLEQLINGYRNGFERADATSVQEIIADEIRQRGL